MQTLEDGSRYIHLGQPATQLSGGEAQRVKLSSELSRRATSRTMYILDEPTTRLHFADIERLLGVLQRLADGGNTILVIGTISTSSSPLTGSSTWVPKEAAAAAGLLPLALLKKWR
ncbi:MAG: hypothetical protein R2839_10665 [Thermomicrobiales bacterium]